MARMKRENVSGTIKIKILIRLERVSKRLQELIYPTNYSIANRGEKHL